MHACVRACVRVCVCVCFRTAVRYSYRVQLYCSDYRLMIERVKTVNWTNKISRSGGRVSTATGSGGSVGAIDQDPGCERDDLSRESHRSGEASAACLRSKE